VRRTPQPLGEPRNSHQASPTAGQKGYGSSQLADIQKIIAAENSDISNVLRYVAYTRAPITRQERVDIARPRINQSYTEKQQFFLDFVLSHYVDQGVQQLETTKLSALIELKGRSRSDAVLELGPVPEIRDLFRNFQPMLYVRLAPKPLTHPLQ
jgi:type I restriction enzyme R subunit